MGDELIEFNIDEYGTEEQIAQLAKIKKVATDFINDPACEQFILIRIEPHEDGYVFASTNAGFGPHELINLQDYFTRLLKLIKQQMNQ
jgi:hypothetical protein